MDYIYIYTSTNLVWFTNLRVLGKLQISTGTPTVVTSGDEVAIRE